MLPRYSKFHSLSKLNPLSPWIGVKSKNPLFYPLAHQFSCPVPGKLRLPFQSFFPELITKAFRHGFPEHRAGTLRIELERSEHAVTLRVADNGIGVASTQVPNKVIGSGASIVDALVKDELEGTVDFHSDEQGTTVTVAFPDDCLVRTGA